MLRARTGGSSPRPATASSTARTSSAFESGGIHSAATAVRPRCAEARTPIANDGSHPDHRRFPSRLPYRLLVAKADDNVASPRDAEILPIRIQRGPHSEIEADEYARGVQALLRAAARTAS